MTLITGGQADRRSPRHTLDSTQRDSHDGKVLVSAMYLGAMLKKKLCPDFNQEPNYLLFTESAALHHKPYDSLLYYLGKTVLYDQLQGG